MLRFSHVSWFAPYGRHCVPRLRIALLTYLRPTARATGPAVATCDMNSHLHSVVCVALTDGPENIAAGRPESQPMVTAIGCSPFVVSDCASHSIPCAPSLILVRPLIALDAESFMARLSFPFGKTMGEVPRLGSTRKCG